MKNSIKRGLSFGLTSGIITTLGLMVGMYSTIESKQVVIGAIVTIAVADALSDALGIHLSEESQVKSDTKNIWLSTIFTFLTKFLVATTFVIPVLIFPLSLAIIISVLWGFSLLVLFNYYIAKQKNENPTSVIVEHVTIALIVIIVTYYLGIFVKGYFG